MTQERQLFLVLAGDLERDRSGGIILGRRTKQLCSWAVQRVRLATEREPVLFAAAGHAGPKWDNIHMGSKMALWMQGVEPDCRTDYVTAEEFNTLGELIATAKYVRQEAAAGRPFSWVTVICEEFRYDRVAELVDELCDLYSMRTPWDVNYVNTHEGLRMLYWLPYELFSTIKNRDRLAQLVPLRPT